MKMTILKTLGMNLIQHYVRMILKKSYIKFSQMTIQNGCHLPLLKCVKNMKQTISHELLNTF